MKKVEMVSMRRPPPRGSRTRKGRELPRVFDQQTRVEVVKFHVVRGPGLTSVCGSTYFKPTICQENTRLPILHPGMRDRFFE